MYLLLTILSTSFSLSHHLTRWPSIQSCIFSKHFYPFVLFVINTYPSIPLISLLIHFYSNIDKTSNSGFKSNLKIHFVLNLYLNKKFIPYSVPKQFWAHVCRYMESAKASPVRATTTARRGCPVLIMSIMWSTRRRSIRWRASVRVNQSDEKSWKNNTVMSNPISFLKWWWLSTRGTVYVCPIDSVQSHDFWRELDFEWILWKLMKCFSFSSILDNECQTSSECDASRGLCCQVIKRHRMAPRKLCYYFSDPQSCIGTVDVTYAKPLHHSPTNVFFKARIG